MSDISTFLLKGELEAFLREVSPEDLKVQLAQLLSLEGDINFNENVRVLAAALDRAAIERLLETKKKGTTFPHFQHID